ncbi:USP6 N-terminal-like protein [Cynocephalus volans]|uniref:USP6 N-terminal-like protein n=1 Tax=Cynocephalus volans TaxID=110931 RepID=UPI002FCA9506
MKTGMETLWAQEVIDIMEKYQQGHRAGTLVKNWDEEFKIYRRIDRLGFLHEKELPRVTTQEVKMSRRVYKGIPPQVRGRAWSLLLGVDKVKMQNPGKYQRMKEQGKMLCQQIQKIDLEVSCTFTNHVMFRDRYGIKQQELFHVLVAFSAYDTEVGYCEGMSHIAAILLMHLNEEDAFWALVQLMTNQRHNMHGFYIPGAPKLRRLLFFHEQLLRTMLPQLHKHLDDQGVIADVYTYWFSQCFIDEIPFHLSLRIFDVFILEGEPLLTGMAYTTMKIHGKLLQNLHQAGILRFFTEKLSRDWVLQDDEVLRQLQVSMEEVRGAKCGLAPLARRDEFPRKILGLDLVSSGPGPRLASRSMETHPRDVGLAISNPPAKAQRHEGACSEPRAASLSLGARGNQGVAGLSPVQDRAPVQDRPPVIWKLLQWSSLPNLPSDVDFGAPWFPNVSFQQECWVRATCPSAVAKP